MVYILLIKKKIYFFDAIWNNSFASFSSKLYTRSYNIEFLSFNKSFGVPMSFSSPLDKHLTKKSV